MRRLAPAPPPPAAPPPPRAAPPPPSSAIPEFLTPDYAARHPECVIPLTTPSACLRVARLLYPSPPLAASPPSPFQRIFATPLNPPSESDILNILAQLHTLRSLAHRLNSLQRHPLATRDRLALRCLIRASSSLASIANFDELLIRCANLQNLLRAHANFSPSVLSQAPTSQPLLTPIQQNAFRCLLALSRQFPSLRFLRNIRNTTPSLPSLLSLRTPRLLVRDLNPDTRSPCFGRTYDLGEIDLLFGCDPSSSTNWSFLAAPTPTSAFAHISSGRWFHPNCGEVHHLPSAQCTGEAEHRIRAALGRGDLFTAFQLRCILINSYDSRNRPYCALHHWPSISSPDSPAVLPPALRRCTSCNIEFSSLDAAATICATCSSPTPTPTPIPTPTPTPDTLDDRPPQSPLLAHESPHSRIRSQQEAMTYWYGRTALPPHDATFPDVCCISGASGRVVVDFTRLPPPSDLSSRRAFSLPFHPAPLCRVRHPLTPDAPPVTLHLCLLPYFIQEYPHAFPPAPYCVFRYERPYLFFPIGLVSSNSHLRSFIPFFLQHFPNSSLGRAGSEDPPLLPSTT